MLQTPATLMLPDKDGHIAHFTINPGTAAPASGGWNRTAFAAAHVVTDPKLVKEPLEKPGRVIKVPRGSKREHLAALKSS